MRRSILSVVPVVGLVAVAVGLTTPLSSAAACSVRGTYCGYPSWAANAFERPHGYDYGTSSPAPSRGVPSPKVRKRR